MEHITKIQEQLQGPLLATSKIIRAPKQFRVNRSLKNKNAAAAAAKSLQSCLALCDTIDRLHRPWDSPGKNTRVGYHFLLQCKKVKSYSEVAQSCPTLCNSMDCSPPGSSVRGIFQARVLEWVAIAFSGKIRIGRNIKEGKGRVVAYSRIPSALLVNIEEMLELEN